MLDHSVLWSSFYYSMNLNLLNHLEKWDCSLMFRSFHNLYIFLDREMHNILLARMCYSKASLMVWGHVYCLLCGCFILLQAARFFSELHIYKPALNRWSHVVTLSHQSPQPVAGHSASVVGDQMVVFGGSQVPGVRYCVTSINWAVCKLHIVQKEMFYLLYHTESID